jgi:hypothetical protein
VSGILAAKGEEEGCVGEWGWRGGGHGRDLQGYVPWLDEKRERTR